MSGPPGGVEPGGDVPHCYRHPDRETYIRCTRCGRPICPDCMVTAPVGFHCPDCVAEANRSVRQARTPLGGKVAATGDLVTKVLIALNVGVYLLGLAVGPEVVVGEGALTPLAAFRDELVGVAVGDYQRLLTAAFVHTAIWHIGVNMYALWILGSLVEPVLGRARFLALYLVSAVGGSAASVAFLPVGGVSYGASGAVFGLFGAVFVILRRFGRDVTGVLVILALNMALPFLIPAIDWRAHLGGLVTGAVLAYVFAHAPRRVRAPAAVAAVVAALLAIGAAVVVAMSRLTG